MANFPEEDRWPSDDKRAATTAAAIDLSWKISLIHAGPGEDEDSQKRFGQAARHLASNLVRLNRLLSDPSQLEPLRRANPYPVSMVGRFGESFAELSYFLGHGYWLWLLTANYGDHGHRSPGFSTAKDGSDFRLAIINEQGAAEVWPSIVEHLPPFGALSHVELGMQLRKEFMRAYPDEAIIPTGDDDQDVNSERMTISARMHVKLDNDPDSSDWPASKWAEFLDCSEGTVKGGDAWKNRIMQRRREDGLARDNRLAALNETRRRAVG